MTASLVIKRQFLVHTFVAFLDFVFRFMPDFIGKQYYEIIYERFFTFPFVHRDNKDVMCFYYFLTRTFREVGEHRYVLNIAVWSNSFECRHWSLKFNLEYIESLSLIKRFLDEIQFPILRSDFELVRGIHRSMGIGEGNEISWRFNYWSRWNAFGASSETRRKNKFLNKFVSNLVWNQDSSECFALAQQFYTKLDPGFIVNGLEMRRLYSKTIKRLAMYCDKICLYNLDVSYSRLQTPLYKDEPTKDGDRGCFPFMRIPCMNITGGLPDDINFKILQDMLFDRLVKGYSFSSYNERLKFRSSPLYGFALYKFEDLIYRGKFNKHPPLVKIDATRTAPFDENLDMVEFRGDIRLWEL